MTTRDFQRGEFVIEYIGDLISMSKANERELMYAADDNTGCYMYYFKHNEQQYWWVWTFQHSEMNLSFEMFFAALTQRQRLAN